MEVTCHQLSKPSHLLLRRDTLNIWIWKGWKCRYEQWHRANSDKEELSIASFLPQGNTEAEGTNGVKWQFIRITGSVGPQVPRVYESYLRSEGILQIQFSELRDGRVLYRGVHRKALCAHTGRRSNFRTKACSTVGEECQPPPEAKGGRKRCSSQASAGSSALLLTDLDSNAALPFLSPELGK